MNDEEVIASKRYSSIKSRVKKEYDLDALWGRKNFIEWYINKEKKCCYCGNNQLDIKKIHANIHSKRSGTRGKNFEIERICANGKYEKNNCELVCYWCNNAKSDFFTFDDFKPIGFLIGNKLKELSNKTL